jgi:hypothetical protein
MVMSSNIVLVECIGYGGLDSSTFPLDLGSVYIAEKTDHTLLGGSSGIYSVFMADDGTGDSLKYIVSNLDTNDAPLDEITVEEALLLNLDDDSLSRVKAFDEIKSNHTSDFQSEELDRGEGKVDWDTFVRSLINFDDINDPEPDTDNEDVSEKNIASDVDGMDLDYATMIMEKIKASSPDLFISIVNMIYQIKKTL